MPQACIYFEEKTMTAAKAQAAREGLSLSRHLATLVEEREKASRWPDRFFATFGALDDDFALPERPDWSLDAAREDFWR